MGIPDDDGLGSREYFGSEAAIFGGQTPLLEGEDWFYYVMVAGISIGDERVALPDGVFSRIDGREDEFVMH